MRKAIILAIVSLLIVPATYAGTSALRLQRVSLTNVNDAAGTTQYEGGRVFRGATQVGVFGATRRVINGGTNPLNTSMFTLTLFFTGTNPPRNVTMQGAWTFSPGSGSGGVSAASAPYQFLEHDGYFTMVPTSAGVYTLTLNWIAGSTVP